jgi:hypothetical protein
MVAIYDPTLDPGGGSADLSTNMMVELLSPERR